MAYQWTKTDATAPERVLLIGLDCGDYDAEASMAELERLTDTAGGLVVGAGGRYLHRQRAGGKSG